MPEIHPAIIVPLVAKLGPAMTKLNDRQRAFVVAMLEFGGINNTKAAIAAGYPADSARSTAHRLAADEDIINAIHEEAHRRLRSGAIMGVNKLLEIANDDTKKTADQLKAIEMLLNRANLPEVREQKVEVTHREESDEDKIRHIIRLAKRNDLDPVQLLGNIGITARVPWVKQLFEQNGITVDAEFTEVPAGNAAPTQPPDDLSDIY